MPTENGAIGARGRREWVASIFAAVVILKKPFTPLEVPFVFSGLIWMPSGPLTQDAVEEAEVHCR